MFEFKTREPNERRIYKTVNGLNLPMDIYLPDCEVDKNTRCIVAIHGGGWYGAIKDNSEWDGGFMRCHARYFAEQGDIAIAISYRSLDAYEGISVYDLIEDCTDAIKYIKDNLDYVNHDRIVIEGESAGGHLAAMLGLSQDDYIRPLGVAAINPVLDCTEKWSYGALPGQDKYGASPLHQNPVKCADFFLMHGLNDVTVDIGDTEKFYDKLKELNHKVDFVKVEGAVHAFTLFGYQSTDEYAFHYTKMIYDYIVKHW